MPIVINYYTISHPTVKLEKILDYDDISKHH